MNLKTSLFGIDNPEELLLFILNFNMILYVSGILVDNEKI